MKQTFDFANLNAHTREEIIKNIRTLRETKGKEKETLEAINKAIVSGHGFVVDLFWEEALVYQHVLMEELAKKDKQNDSVVQKALKNMEAAVLEAKAYIEKYELDHWESRLYRFLGRISDYKGEFEKSVAFYKKALATVDKDPDRTKGDMPRHLELEAFFLYAKMMAGEVEKGVKDSRKLYAKFENDKEAKKFKENDYAAWAIWRTGIPIRVGYVFLKTEKGIAKEDLLTWLKDARVLLEPQDKEKLWADFKLRKKEIGSIEERLKLL